MLGNLKRWGSGRLHSHLLCHWSGAVAGEVLVHLAAHEYGSTMEEAQGGEVGQLESSVSCADLK